MIKKLFKSAVDRAGYGQLYRNHRDLSDRNQPFIESPWGFKFSGHSQMAKGTFEPEETKLIRDLLQGVDLLVNVGANVGYYCCHALSLGKSVIAVEPVTRNLHYLMRNININGWQHRTEIFPVALGSKSDVLNIWGGGTGASLIKGWAGIPESYVTQVPVLTMDRILGKTMEGKRPLILVDVEGFEYELLKGAEKTLQNDIRPIWIVEIGTTTHQPTGVTVNPYLEATFKKFFENGYSAVTADEKRVPVNIESVKEVAKGNHSFTTHNFLFC